MTEGWKGREEQCQGGAPGGVSSLSVFEFFPKPSASSFLCWANPIPPGARPPSRTPPGLQASPASHTEAAACSLQLRIQAPQWPLAWVTRGRCLPLRSHGPSVNKGRARGERPREMPGAPGSDHRQGSPPWAGGSGRDLGGQAMPRLRPEAQRAQGCWETSSRRFHLLTQVSV